MRALGPGSVSSFLKIILDVVFVVLWMVIALAAVLAFLAVLLSYRPEVLANVRINGAPVADRGPLLAGGLLAFAVNVAGILLIVGALRRIFLTLTAGDPFHPANISRLRLIGLVLAGLEFGRYVVWTAVTWLPRDVVQTSRPSFNLTAWFSVLVVFVLAEVFREGARLRREAELTI